MLSIECEFCIYLLDRYYTALTNSCDRSFFLQILQTVVLDNLFFADNRSVQLFTNWCSGHLFCKLSFWPTFFCKLSFCTTFFVNCCPGQLFSCRWSFWPYFWELLFRTSFLQIVVPDNYFANCPCRSSFLRLYEL